MPEAKGIWEGLLDFSFRVYATPRMLEFLYALHLLVGLVAGVAWVALSFQQAPVQGLLALLGARVGYFFWILHCRVILEVLAPYFAWPMQSRQNGQSCSNALEQNSFNRVPHRLTNCPNRRYRQAVRYMIGSVIL